MIFAGSACDRILVLQIAGWWCSFCKVCGGCLREEILGQLWGLVCLWQNFCTADCQVCGLNRTCREWKFRAPFGKTQLCWPASDRIFVLQIARFVVFTGPAADEILEFHFVRLMVLAVLPVIEFFVFQIARFVVLTGPAADEILQLHFVRLMVFQLSRSDSFFRNYDETVSSKKSFHLLQQNFTRYSKIENPLNRMVLSFFDWLEKSFLHFQDLKLWDNVSSVSECYNSAAAFLLEFRIIMSEQEFKKTWVLSIWWASGGSRISRTRHASTVERRVIWPNCSEPKKWFGYCPWLARCVTWSVYDWAPPFDTFQLLMLEWESDHCGAFPSCTRLDSSDTTSMSVWSSLNNSSLLSCLVGPSRRIHKWFRSKVISLSFSFPSVVMEDPKWSTQSKSVKES